MSPIVAARGWGYRHAGRSHWAVRGLDLAIEPGERVLLAGASGAGKSTLLSAMAGLLDTDHSGDTEGELVAPERSRVGMVFQDPESQLVMATAGDDVAFGLENHAVPTERIWPRVHDALATVGFGHPPDRPTGRLSGGEKQRLVLAGVLALEPSLLLLDEPTANLDPAGAAMVRETVRQAVQRTDATLLLVEHRVEDWISMIDRVVVLAPGGGVLADGAPDSVFASHGAELAEAGVWVPGFDPPAVPPGTPGADVLSAEDLRYAYPRQESSRPAVDQVSVRLASGEILGITGENGSGKSTLAMVLSGLLAPDGGRVLLSPDQLAGGAANGVPATGVAGISGRRRDRASRRDRPLHQLPADELIRLVGTVFQDPEHQFLRPTVRQELALGPRLAGHPPDRIEARVDELLIRLRLDHVAQANPYTLSGGEKRRLSVATALATSPRVLVLDEPTFGQDRRTWIELVRLLSTLRDDGHAIVCVSHDEVFLRTLADRRLALADGRPVAIPEPSGRTARTVRPTPRAPAGSLADGAGEDGSS